MEKKHGISQILNGTAIFYLHWNLPKLPSFVGLHRPAPLSILGYGCTKANGGVVAGVPLRFPIAKWTSRRVTKRFQDGIQSTLLQGLFEVWQPQKAKEDWAASWWFQPLWKKLVKLDHFPQVGVQIKNLWNHHPGSDQPSYSNDTSQPFGMP